MFFPPHFSKIVVEVKAKGSPHVLKIVGEVKAEGPPHVLKIVGEVKAKGSPHVLKIVVEAKAEGPPHVLLLWLWVSKGMLPVKVLFLQQSLHLCQSNFMEIISLLRS